MQQVPTINTGFETNGSESLLSEGTMVLHFWVGAIDETRKSWLKVNHDLYHAGYMVQLTGNAFHLGSHLESLTNIHSLKWREEANVCLVFTGFR